MNNILLEAFNNGYLKLPTTIVKFAEIPWSQHSTFEGVKLKHMITSKDTDRQFSYHLVRITPNKDTQKHIHETPLEIHEAISGSGICINHAPQFLMKLK